MTFQICCALKENPEAGTAPLRSPASPPGAIEWKNRCLKLATFSNNNRIRQTAYLHVIKSKTSTSLSNIQEKYKRWKRSFIKAISRKSKLHSTTRTTGKKKKSNYLNEKNEEVIKQSIWGHHKFTSRLSNFLSCKQFSKELIVWNFHLHAMYTECPYDMT